MIQFGASISSLKNRNWAFVNYTNLESMQDVSTITQIRKHAMKQAGAAKKRPHGRKHTNIELYWVPTVPETSKSSESEQSRVEGDQMAAWMKIRAMRIAEDKVLYDTFVRSLSCKIDPFSTASIPLDATAQSLLQYFVYHASRYPNSWTFSSSSLLPSRPSDHKNSIYSTVASALQDSLLANCLLGTAASRICYVDGTLQLHLKRRELSLTQNALHSLRGRLESVASEDRQSVEILVVCMLHLGSSAFYKGDIGTSMLHIRAAITLAQHLGGVNALHDPYVKGRIISFDDLISCVKLRPCLLKNDYDPGPPSLPLRRVSRQSARNEPQCYGLMLINSPILPSNLLEPVRQIVECHEVQLHILQAGSIPGIDNLASRQWVTMRLVAIRNRLLAFEPTNRRTEILRVVLLMWTLLPWNVVRAATIVNTVAPKLRYMLAQDPTLDWQEHEDLYLWCLLMGYCCSREGSDDQNWFVDAIRRQLGKGRFEISNERTLLGDLVGFQKRFLYQESVQKLSTERLTGLLFNIEQIHTKPA